MRKVLASLLVFTSVIVIIIPTLLVRGCTIGESELRKPGGSVLKVFNVQEQQVMDMELEEYIKGVVAAEMPAEFEQEALKAQAVVARTYVLRRKLRGTTIPEHPQAIISTDHQNGQEWKSKEELQEKWGGFFKYLIYWNKISQAVDATAGQVLTYRQELIDAVYHSNAGGQTEDAAYVWGNPFPYLKSVGSPFDTDSPKYTQKVTLSWVELDQRLDTSLAQKIQSVDPVEVACFLENENSLIEILEISPSKRILQIRLGEVVLTGKDFRAQLGLSSTRLELIPTTQGLQITTYGNGHGVGMSQYGANGMAKNGTKYHEILNHYYPGTQLKSYRFK